MSEFTVYPAIDLLEGEVVRLKQGDRRQKTVYSRDPAEFVEKWTRAGARWLHVVNLDGAFGTDARRTRMALRRLMTAVGTDVQVQVGGGVRKFGDVEALLLLGAARVVLGTAAIENPALLEEVIGAFGAETVVVSIDARDGFVQTRGWQSDSDVQAVDLGRTVRDLGVRTVIYTNISRDGMGAGVDRAGAQALAATGLEVIASGGAASVDDVVRAREVGLAGVIIGRALYEGQLDLADMIAAAGGSR